MYGSFNCPGCGRLLRVRRNFPMRILRLALTVPVLMWVLVEISDWFKLHLHLTFAFSAASIGAMDEYVMRLFPVNIEPGASGGLGVS